MSQEEDCLKGNMKVILVNKDEPLVTNQLEFMKFIQICMQIKKNTKKNGDYR